MILQVTQTEEGVELSKTGTEGKMVFRNKRLLVNSASVLAEEVKLHLMGDVDIDVNDDYVDFIATEEDALYIVERISAEEYREYMEKRNSDDG